MTRVETVEGSPTFYAATTADWRAWLEQNGRAGGRVWLVLYRKHSPTPSVGYGEAIEHALCFGWIDSKALKRDDESFYLSFYPRNPKSTWSKVNRERAERMIRDGQMRPPGQAMIDLAKETGTWDLLADADDLVVPDDLQAELDRNPVAYENFQRFPPSSQRRILAWIATAKRPDTRQRRIDQTVALAEDNKRANH